MEVDELPYDYVYNYTDIPPLSTLHWENIFAPVLAVVIFLFNVILMVAIFLDRRAYEKTRPFLLLNYWFNYPMFAIFFYFHNVHLYLFQDFPQSSCVFIITSYSVFDDGTSYFILPLCLDFVVKYFKPNKYESQRFLHIQYILTFVLWAFIWIKNLIIFLALSSFGTNGCYFYMYTNSFWIHYIATILLVIAMVVFLGLLIYIAVKGKERGLTKSPLITLIVIVTVTILSSVPKNIIWAAMNTGMDSISYIAYSSLNMIRFLVVPFLFLPDATIRQSLRKLCLCKYKRPREPPSHELSTEVN